MPKSKRSFGERIRPPAASNKDLSTAINQIDTKLHVKFDGNCLTQGKVTFTHKKEVNIYIVYSMNLWSYTWAACLKLNNSFFGAV